MLSYDMGARGELSLYEYLYRRIREDILAGRIAAGEKLPSKRRLAAQLGVSVITVEGAYGQLVAEGYCQSVLFCGRRETLIAACFGSALSDLIGGFPLWILPTHIIKFFMADIAWRVIRPDKTKASPARLVVGFLLASAWMAAAYTLFGALLYDSLAAGLASAPGLIAEGVLNSAIAIVAAGILQKTPLGQR